MVRNPEYGFGADLAMDKLAVTGSSVGVIRMLMSKLGDLAGPCEDLSTAAVNLGVDFRPGGKRSTFKKVRRRQRLASALARRRRVLRVRRRLAGRKGRMSRIVSAGMAPGLGFGACVNGLTDAELTRARNILFAATPP